VKRKKVNWQTEADLLVMQQLIRAAEVDTRSAIGKLAHQRLMEIAEDENPILFKEVLTERKQMRNSFTRLLAAWVHKFP
jgi:hypothetical protein